MTKISVKVNGSSLTASADGKLTSGMVGVVVSIDYDNSWDNLIKTASFRVGSFVRSRRNIQNSTTVPWEVMRHHGKPLEVGVEGRDEDGNIVIPTVWAVVGTVYEGAVRGINGSPNLDDGGGDDASSKAVLYVKQNLSKEQKAQARANIGVDVPEPDLSGLVKSVNGVAPDENGNVEVSGGGIAVTGARVGQTVVVKSVDSNGVPTEWEMAALPTDTHIRSLIDTALGVIENGTY